MSILINTNIEREYIVIPIIPIGGIHLDLKTKQPYLSLYWQKYNRKNFNNHTNINGE